LLAAPDITARIDPRLATREQLENEMSRVTRRIQSMQLYNGAFSPWQMSGASEWLSVYTTHFLVACEKEGIAVPRETLRSALEYVKYLLAQTPEFYDKQAYCGGLAVRAYISYILAIKGEAPLAWMSYLHDNLASMPQYGRILLAAAYASANDKKTAISMLGEQAPQVAGYDGTEQLNFDSPLRTQALYLMAWNEVDPTSPSAVTTAAQLLNSFRSSRWYTTQEAGWAMLALSDFYSANSSKGEAVLTMSAPATGELAVTSGDRSVNQTIEESVRAIQISNTGSGTGYATWTSDGVPTTPPAPEDLGMKATVRYFDSNSFEITNGSIVKNGDKVYGEIILRPLGGNLKNIVVALPLAGGLEIENPKLMEPENEYEGNYEYGDNYYSTSRTELRDDRLLLFVDYVGREFKWKFSMRAITSGTFTLPPIAAEGMYSPGIRSIGPTSAITIR
jgi:uncharacterized protein YfaS (alpha-2-macroglobulin family)